MKLWRLMIIVMLSPLLVMLASPPAQAYSGVYYIIPTSVPLRECAAPECDVKSTPFLDSAQWWLKAVADS